MGQPRPLLDEGDVLDPPPDVRRGRRHDRPPHEHSRTSLKSHTYTDEDMLELREPMRLFDNKDVRERRRRTMRAEGTP